MPDPEPAGLPEPSDEPAGSPEPSDYGENRRAICWEGCGRPASVCLCPFLPPSPIPTVTRVVVLHHPHELRRNPLATLPILSLCLQNLTLISGRRLRPNLLLDSSDLLLLFPSPAAADVAAIAPTLKTPQTLIVIDGTWRHAREMAAASREFLSAREVSVGGCRYEGGGGGSKFDGSGLVLREEPHRGCVSTVEAVARALRALEPEGRGEEIEGRLMEVLRAMVGFQARHLRPMAPRVKMKKKKKEMKRLEREEGGSCSME